MIIFYIAYKYISMAQIDLFYFLLTLFIGIFFVYVTSPKPTIIIKTPITGKNENKTSKNSF